MSKRDIILSASLKLLASKGVHATPMSAIAKEAKTGMGTIYNYFSNKDKLLNELYVSIKKEEKSIFKEFNSKRSLKNQFEKYYANVIYFYIKNPLYFQFIEQIHASPIITEESKIIGYESINSVSKLIERGKKEKLIKQIATNDLIQFIGGTVISFLRLHFQEKKKKRFTLNNQLKMVWDAIKK